MSKGTTQRKVRVEDALWEAATAATAALGTNPSEVMRKALARYVKAHPVTAEEREREGATVAR